MQFDFNNMTVVITGGAQGLGYEVAKSFSLAGARLALIDVHREKLYRVTESLEGEVIPLVCDVTDYNAVHEAINKIENKTHTIHVLVNNAGIVSTENLINTSPEQWKRILEVNLSGAFYCLQATAKIMIHHKTKGKIINISSLAGRNGGLMVSPAYSASKAGLIGLTKAAARQLAPDHITVNAVAPGSLESEMLSSFGDDKVEALKKTIPLGRLGKFLDVKDIVLFLASPEAEFITGVCIDVNGGQYIAP